MEIGGGVRRRKNRMSVSNDSECVVACASWVPVRAPHNENGNESGDMIVLARAEKTGGGGGARSPAGGRLILEIAAYDFKGDVFVSKGNLVVEQGEDEDESVVPVGIAMHPGGDGLILSSRLESCKYFELDEGKSKLKLSDKVLPSLLGARSQKCLLFSADGCKLAAVGEGGHLCVFEWPSMKVLLDEQKVESSFKDLDFSLDSAFLVLTSNAGSARVWDIIKAVPVTTLTLDQGERIEFCRFSRDGTKPFLFCTVTKGGKGNIMVWDMSTWRKIGGKKFFDKPISAFNISWDGKFLALGSIEGDICVIEVQKMQVQDLFKRAHVGATVRSVEFSSNGRALLSVSNEWAAKINTIHRAADWKDWQIYLVLLLMVFISAILFYIFFEYSDSFWNFPLGREQPARPPIEAILGDDHNIS